jgi:hypothetical protein
MSFLSSIFGSKPTVPTLPSLSLGTEQGKAIANNQAALPASEKLVSQANTFTQQQIQSMLEQAIPGYKNLVSSVSGNIQGMVGGQIPTDVQTAVQQSSAASAVAGGYGGSEMAGNLTARDLGMTSLDIMNQGISTAQSWMAELDKLFSPGMLDVSSMFVTPGQQASFDVEERNAQFQQQWMQNQIAAMPDPIAAGIYEGIQSNFNAFLGSAGSLMKMGAGGGAGGGFGAMATAGGGGGGGSGGGGVPWIGDYGSGGSD